MNYLRLENNVISVIKEALLKLGYESHAIGVNYTEPSLCHLLGCKPEELKELLNGFCDCCAEKFGEVSYAEREGGYRLDIPSQGVDYVHSLLSDDEFLASFIRTVRKPGCTIEDVKNVFLSYSSAVHFEEVDNGEFDWLIYFENGDIDDFWYCLHDDGLQLEYHRFIKEDYLDFNF